MKISPIKILLFLFLIVLFSAFYIWQNDIVVTSHYKYESPEIPESFNGFKILQISDWHNKDYGIKLINKINEISPDIIVITGDFLDLYNPDEELAFNFLDDLTSDYPVYFVTGNHEEALFKRDKILKEELKQKDITFLENSSIEIIRNNESITIYGINDYLRHKNVEYDLQKTFTTKPTTFSILLAHEPEYFEEYSEFDINLIFSGHEHGGQIRLPYIGSIYSHQGWFADWTAGMHKLNNSTIIVSRGLANSKTLPMRLFNQPEIVLATLNAQK